MRTNTMTVNGNKVLHTSTNKKAFWFWNDYENSTITTVLQAYRTKPSQAKQEAENAILREMREIGGTDYRILSHSGFVFTCGYLVQAVPVKVLRVETRDNTYYIVKDGEYISK